MTKVLQFPCWCGKPSKVNGLCMLHHKGFLAVRREMVEEAFKIKGNEPRSTVWSRKQRERAA